MRGIGLQLKQQFGLPWIIPASVWLGVTSWRPFVLGFYHDDWITLKEVAPRSLIADISTELTDQASRPLYGVLAVILRRLVPFNPIIWQLFMGLLIAASALAIGIFSSRLIMWATDDPATVRWSGAIAAATWIAIPWDLGVTAWPTTFAAQISVIGFCALGYAIFDADSLKRRFMKAMLAFLLVSLISELFWISFIPLLFISLGLERKGQTAHEKRREAAILLSGFCVVQLFLVGLNRIVVHMSPATSRTFSHAWVNTVFLSLRLLPVEFKRSVLWPQASWLLIGVVLLGLVVGACFHPKRRLIALTIFAIVSGSFISIVLFALAGYRVESLGTSSRTAVVISVWLSLIPALVLAVSKRFGRPAQICACCTTVLLVLILSLSSINDLQAWIKSWDFEKQVLKHFPATDIAQGAAQNSFVLVDAEHPDTYAEGFEAYWDISAGLYTSYPVLRKAFTPNGFRYFASMANLSKMQTLWDGRLLIQSWCTAPRTSLWELKAPGNLYLWRKSEQEFVRITPPIKLGCSRKE